MSVQLYDGSSFMTVQHQSAENAMTVQLYGGSGILKFPKLAIAMTVRSYDRFGCKRYNRSGDKTAQGLYMDMRYDRFEQSL